MHGMSSNFQNNKINFFVNKTLRNNVEQKQLLLSLKRRCFPFFPSNIINRVKRHDGDRYPGVRIITLSQWLNFKLSGIICLPSLKLTYPLKNGWLEYKPFLLGSRPIFRCEPLVSGSVNFLGSHGNLSGSRTAD